MIEHGVSIGHSTVEALEKITVPSPLTCPECGGPLWQVRDTVASPRFRCHTGHAFGLSSLKDAFDDALERILFEAMRALHEQHELYTRTAVYRLHVGDTGESRRYTVAASRAAAYAKRIEGWLREG